MLRFQNRVVIVTGGAKGIGSGCVRVFCREGARVAILDRDVAAGEEFAASLTAEGPGVARLWNCDVTDLPFFQKTIGQVAQEWGQIDCLINNVGTHPPATTIEETSLESLDHLLRLNFVTTFAAIQAALPSLRKTRGTIVNISSMTAVLGQNLAAAYSATKAAQIGLTKSLAIELGSAGIRVNAILPSNIDTPLMHQWAATLEDPASAIEHMASLQVFKRLGTPEEMGRIALFLASEDSSFVTGQAIEAEGGASLDY